MGKRHINALKTSKHFQQEIAKNGLELVGEYSGAQEKATCFCIKCQNTFDIIARNAIRRGCPRCWAHNKIIAEYDTHIEVDVSTPTHTVAVMKISRADWEYIKSLGVGRANAYRLNEHSCLYVATRIKQKFTAVHRLLFPNAVRLDHANGDGLDNRRENIRVCTAAQNSWNSKVRVDNTSGNKGVTFVRSTGRYMARIGVAGSRICLGTFPTMSEASAAYNEASVRFHGEFSYINRPEASKGGR